MLTLRARFTTSSILLTAALVLTACSSNDDAEEATTPDAGGVGAAGDGAAPGAPGAAAIDPIRVLLEGSLSVFGETVATDMPHSVPGGEFEVVARYVKDQPVFHLTLPVNPAEVGRPLPVVVWANGGCLRSDFLWQKGMFDLWAANGIATLALTGTEGSGDVFGMIGFTTSAEQRALVDWVEKQNESGPYKGIFDLDRVVFAGNSCGGNLSLESASLDERASAVFVLSGSSGGESVMKDVTVPVAYVVGGPEDMAAGGASSDYEAMAAGLPGMIAHRFQGDHLTVSSDAVIVADVGKIGLSFMLLALYGSQEAHAELTSGTVCTGCAEGHWRLQSKYLDTLVK